MHQGTLLLYVVLWLSACLSTLRIGYQERRMISPDLRLLQPQRSLHAGPSAKRSKGISKSLIDCVRRDPKLARNFLGSLMR
jgi:hypothetical protein